MGHRNYCSALCFTIITVCLVNTVLVFGKLPYMWVRTEDTVRSWKLHISTYV